MSLFSAIILPELEKQLVVMSPQIAQFLLNHLHTLSLELISYLEEKLDIMPPDPGE